MVTAQKDGTEFGALKIFNSFFDREAGWFFLEYEPWIVYLRLFNQLDLPRPSHCHQDFGSPIIYHKKKELIIDPGRSSYLIDSNNEIKASKHSTFLINNEPTAYSERDLKFFPLPIKPYKVKKYHLGSQIYILIRYPLSLKANFKIKYAIRLFVINKKSIEIRDRISLFKKSNIITRFNFSYPLDKFNRLFSYTIDNNKTKNILLEEESKELCNSKRFLDYNRKHNYKSFSFRAETNKHFCSRFLISE